MLIILISFFMKPISLNQSEIGDKYTLNFAKGKTFTIFFDKKS